jgi:hypothetical protein
MGRLRLAVLLGATAAVTGLAVAVAGGGQLAAGRPDAAARRVADREAPSTACSTAT